MYKNIKIIRILVILLLISTTITSGCAYYNTFYNTKQAYKEGERAIREKLESEITAGDMTNFDLCIRKGSKVLEMYPGSKYVDDTLFLMGKSFYYKKEYVEANRKFEELQRVFPESEYINESILWWGKALIRLEDYDEAAAKIDELMAIKDLKKDLRNEALLEIAGVSFRQQNYDEAEKAFDELTAMIDDKKALARVWFQMGMAYYHQEKYTKAAESFLNVLKYKPSDKDKYQSKFFAGVSFKLDGQFENANRIFEELLSDGKNSEHFAEIRLEMTDCLTLQGKVEESIQEFKEIAEYYPRTIAMTRAYGLIGLIYYEKQDYPLAKAAFDSALKGVKDSVTTDKVVPLAEYLRSLDKYHTSIDTSLEAIDKNKDKDNSEIEEVTVDSTGDSLAVLSSELFYERERRLQADSYAKHFYLAGELFLYKIKVPDSSKIYLDYIVENFPESSYAPRALLLLSRIFRDEEGDTVKAREMLRKITVDYPNDEFVNIAREELGMAPAAILHDSLRTLFLKAESLFFDAQDYEQAIEHYSLICDYYPYSEFSPQSRFLIAWYYENAVTDWERAIEEYEKYLDDYPESPYYRSVNAKVQAAKKDPPKLSDDKDKDESEKRKRRRRFSSR